MKSGSSDLKHRQPRVTFLKRRHHFASTAAHLGGVGVPRLGGGVALLAIHEERLFRSEEPSAPGNLSETPSSLRVHGGALGRRRRPTTWWRRRAACDT